MKRPKFLDSARFQQPYVCAAESEKVGYLDARFAIYRAKQEAAEAETRDKLRQIRKAAK